MDSNEIERFQERHSAFFLDTLAAMQSGFAFSVPRVCSRPLAVKEFFLELRVELGRLLFG
jgi:hypothetical protein